jgi:superfamily I DNA and/or RNA helicase
MHSLDVRINSSESGMIVKDIRQELDSTLALASKAKRKSDKYKLYQDCKSLRSELKVRENEILQSIIRNADVVLTTLSSSASKLLDNSQFDVLLIDEASQALEVESWIAIGKSSKLILAGDHLQFPPTINQTGKGEKILGLTLFERMLELYGDRAKTLLDIQYRMHKDIMDFSSQYFYNGLLHADSTVSG